MVTTTAELTNAYVPLGAVCSCRVRPTSVARLAARLSALVVVLAGLLCGCGARPNSGDFGAGATGVVSSVDGTCLRAGGPFPEGPTPGPGTTICFSRSVGSRGQCVFVEYHNGVDARMGPPVRWAVGRVTHEPPGTCRLSPTTR